MSATAAGGFYEPRPAPDEILARRRAGKAKAGDREMTESDNTDSFGFLAFAKRVTKLEGDLIDTRDKLEALEKRFEDFTLGRFSPPDVCTIPETNVSVRMLGSQRMPLVDPDNPNWAGTK